MKILNHIITAIEVPAMVEEKNKNEKNRFFYMKNGTYLSIETILKLKLIFNIK